MKRDYYHDIVAGEGTRDSFSFVQRGRTLAQTIVGSDCIVSCKSVAVREHFSYFLLWGKKLRNNQYRWPWSIYEQLMKLFGLALLLSWFDCLSCSSSLRLLTSLHWLLVHLFWAQTPWLALQGPPWPCTHPLVSLPSFYVMFLPNIFAPPPPSIIRCFALWGFCSGIFWEGNEWLSLRRWRRERILCSWWISS